MADARPTFSSREVDGLDEPVRRYFTAAIRPGAPLSSAARLTMRGAIRLGRWVPFTGTEVLAPRTGFLWRATAGGVIVGSDRYLAGEGAMAWFLGGVVPVMRGSGPDVTRSAAARGAGEGVWVPTALLPRSGIEWRAVSDTEITASFAVDEVPVELHLQIDEVGRVQAVWFDRWGVPAGAEEPGWHCFGMTVTATARFGMWSIPSEGVVGWHYGTERWPEGQFFRYRLTDVAPLDG